MKILDIRDAMSREMARLLPQFLIPVRTMQQDESPKKSTTYIRWLRDNFISHINVKKYLKKKMNEFFHTFERVSETACKNTDIEDHKLEETDKLDEWQQAICDYILARPHQNVFITGEAGTGKSHIIKYLRQQKPTALVMTPTGSAASVVGGRTISSSLGLSFLQDYVVEDHVNKKIRDRCLACDMVIIDEISMVSGRFLSTVDSVLRQTAPSVAGPFAGKQVVLIGDLYQLPPVPLGRPFYLSREDFLQQKNPLLDSWVFGRIDANKQLHFTPTWQALNAVYFELEKNYRFAHMPIEDIALMKNLRLGIAPEQSVALLIERTAPPNSFDPQETLTLVCKNAARDAINSKYYAALPGPEYVYDANFYWSREALRTIPDWRRTKTEKQYLEDLALDPRICLKKGCRVMLKTNINPSIGLYNGTLGTVKDVDANHVLFEYKNSRGTVSVQKIPTKCTFRARHVDYDNRLTYELVHLPFILAWASTVHKAQGLTLPKIRVDLSEVFSSHQAYVAISRAPKLDCIELCTTAGLASKFRIDPTVKCFYEHLDANKITPGKMAELNNTFS